MNKRKVTKHKGSKSKIKHEPPEVFVLPPNLLQELGIHLGNIESAPECAVKIQVSDKLSICEEQNVSQEKQKCINISDNHLNVSSEPESSIIKTASLMKKSVLLSPTFISHNTNIIPGDINTVSNAESADVAISELTAHPKNNSYIMDSDQTNKKIFSKSNAHPNNEYDLGSNQMVIKNECQKSEYVPNVQNTNGEKTYNSTQDVKAYKSSEVEANLVGSVELVNTAHPELIAYPSFGDNHSGENIFHNEWQKSISISDIQNLNNTEIWRFSKEIQELDKEYQSSVGKVNIVGNAELVYMGISEANVQPNNEYNFSSNETLEKVSLDDYQKTEHISILKNSYGTKPYVLTQDRNKEYKATQGQLNGGYTDLVDTAIPELNGNYEYLDDNHSGKKISLNDYQKSLSILSMQQSSDTTYMSTQEIDTEKQSTAIVKVIGNADLVEIPIPYLNAHSNNEYNLSSNQIVENRSLNECLKSAASYDLSHSNTNETYMPTLEINRYQLNQHELNVIANSEMLDISISELINTGANNGQLGTNLIDVNNSIHECENSASICNLQSSSDAKTYIPTEHIYTQDQLDQGGSSIDNNTEQMDVVISEPTVFVSGNQTGKNISFDTFLELKNPIIQDKNFISTQEINKNYGSTDGNRDEMHSNTSEILVDEPDEHGDEAYSSDCSNNTGLADKLNDSHSNDFETERERDIKNKGINIISEQILSTLQFKELKWNDPITLIPVTINTVIKSHYKDSITDKSSSNGSLISHSTTDSLKISHDAIVCVTDDALRKQNTVNVPTVTKEVLFNTAKDINLTSLESPFNDSIRLDDSNVIQCKGKEVLTATQEKKSSSQESNNIPITAVNQAEDVVVPNLISPHSSNCGAEGDRRVSDKLNEVCVNAKKITIQENEEDEHLERVNTNANGLNYQVDNMHVNIPTEVPSEMIKLDTTKDIDLGHMEGKSKAFVNCDKSKQTQNPFKGDSSILELNKNKKSHTVKTNCEVTRQVSIDKNVIKEDTLRNNISIFESIKTPKCKESEHENKSEMVRTRGTQISSKSHEIKPTSAPHVHEDKIKEIAKYLSKFADIQRRRNLNEKYNITSANTPSNRKHVTHSKSSIQGVEKPGGVGKIKDRQIGKSIKTYQRKRISKPSERKTIFCSNTSPNTNKSIHKIDLIDNSSSDSTNENDFCVCGDFGRLTFYGNEIPYEHIHFWNRDTIDCPPEVIFSIYNDIPTAPSVKINKGDINMKIVQDEYIPKEVSSRTDYKICWKEIELSEQNSLDPSQTRSEHDLISNHENENNNITNTSKNRCLEGDLLPVISECGPENTEPFRNNTMVSIKLSAKCHRTVKNESNTVKDIEEPTAKKICLLDSALSPKVECRSVNEDLSAVMEHDTVNTISDPTVERSAVNESTAVCGVCHQKVPDADWLQHIASQHSYLAWKVGDSPLDLNNRATLFQHLSGIIKEHQELKCSKCGVTRKYANPFLKHIQQCNFGEESLKDSLLNTPADRAFEVDPVKCLRSTNSLSIENETQSPSDVLIKCGVCEQSIQDKHWYSHLGLEHNYLAWKYGESVLDLNDENAIREHLHGVAKEFGGLKCAKCGLIRKYVKSYLSHTRNCNGLSLNESHNESGSRSSLNVSDFKPIGDASSFIDNVSIENEAELDADVLVKCSVCEKLMENKDWNAHVESQHNYLAWKCGDPILDLNDEEAVREHLLEVLKDNGSLKCSACGLAKTSVRSFLAHIKNCNRLNEAIENVISTNADPNSEPLFEVLVDVEHTELAKCAVCGQYMPPGDWAEHLADKHNYLAWKDGDPPLDVTDDEKVREHLQNIVKESGALACSKCGLRRKHARAYLHHIGKCDGAEVSINDSAYSIEAHPEAAMVKCGVCNKVLNAGSWLTHTFERHDYLAWKEGETPLDVTDETQVYDHLYAIVKEHGDLKCKTCGKTRKYVKSYLDHTRKCGGDNAEANSSVNESCTDSHVIETCGVCQKKVESSKWIHHTQKDHNYLAWKEGEKPWNLDDFIEVNEHLYAISQKMNGLTCNKCGLVRKYVKVYLNHIKTCSVADFNLTSSDAEGIGPLADGEPCRCAMCKKEIDAADWKKHAMNEHYNITWKIGQTPIDIKNPYAVEKYLKEYALVHSLQCNNCGATRASFAGFYAHIITCGKTDEETEIFKNVCEICNNKYLSIYKNQHMLMHRVQEYTKQMKLQGMKRKKENEDKTVTSRKRRAAEKARTVIEDYSNNMSQHAHKCETCGFGTDFESEMQSHRCDKSNEKDFSEDESSAAEGAGSGEETDDSLVESDISRQEEGPKKRIRYKEPTNYPKVSKIPFKVDNVPFFLNQSDQDFCKTHLTDDTLFPQWISSEHTNVSENDLLKYLPSLEKSCRVKSRFNWTSLKRFEALKGDGSVIFVGASITTIAWVPLRVENIRGETQNFLAIACHEGDDSPRYQFDETQEHANLIQIWDFGDCKELPKIVYGIAHDFGTVWSMEWCPSGARDAAPEDPPHEQTRRLGLLAVACSNGFAYIFSVPYPSFLVKNDCFVQKLKPVAELRMTMTSERKQYQATSIVWSKEKGHSTVVVGYADGSIAYYDLNCDSPLLSTVENNVQVFYPFRDERAHNTCVSGLDLYPSALGGIGVVCSATATGAALSAGGARVRSQLGAHGASFAPHWPSALLHGDASLTNTSLNELDWPTAGRRVGGSREFAGCARCTRLAASTPPALRVMRPHPAYSELNKQIFGMLEMIPLRSRKRKQVNDELAMKVEPLTYHDAVHKYGIEYQSVNKRDRAVQARCSAKPKVDYPERFPLAEVKSMAFCPAMRHHEKLAVATHSGVLFFVDVS